MDQRAQDIGMAGENAARCYLEGKGWRFVAANWACRYGEIDLIMQEGSTRVFVEVRVRSRSGYGEALDTVGRRKKLKILRAARWYQVHQDYWGDLRFDVLSITRGPSGNYSIDHIVHAFEEGLQ